MAFYTNSKIQGEYWCDDHGRIIDADGDTGEYNHEDYVMSIVIARICEFIGWDAEDMGFGGGDATGFRVAINDDYFQQPEWVNLEDSWKVLFDKMVEAGVFQRGEIEDVRACLNNRFDARQYAIQWWGWIRIAGNSLEMADFRPATLSRAGEALKEILFDRMGVEDDEESDGVVVNVSIYGKPGRKDTTVGALCDGRVEEVGDAEAELRKQYAAANVKRMDQAIAHPFYGGKLGDSIQAITKVMERLLESDFSDLPPECPYGFWITADLKVLTVKGWAGHWAVAREFFKAADPVTAARRNHGIDYRAKAIDANWIPLVRSLPPGEPTLFMRCGEMTPSPQQVKLSRDLATFYGLKFRADRGTV